MDDNMKQSDDGLKELNTVTVEYYEDKIENEALINENEDKPKKTIYDHIRIGLILISYLIFFFADIIDQGFALMTFAIFLFTVATFFMGAIKKFITEGDHCSLLFRASFFLRIILFLFFFLSLCMIFLTKNIDLKYSYWIAIISFIAIATIEIIETTIEDYRYRKNHSLLSKILRSLLNLFLLFLWLNSIGIILQVTPSPDTKLLNVNELDAPYQIMLIKLDNITSDRLDRIMNHSISITDQSFLNQLSEDLENRSYEPMDMISALNYSKLEYISENYYQLFLYYQDNENNKFLGSPFISLMFIEDKLVLKDGRRHSDRWLFKTLIHDYYNLELSKETRQKLYSYIDKIEE